MKSEVGIAAFGAYIPALRVSRQEISNTHAWINPVKPQPQSERSSAGWDEDSITMAVEAARDCLSGVDRASVQGVYMGTTTAPFSDRLNSGVVAGALGLDEMVIAQDTTGSLRAGTTALLAALAVAGDSSALCTVADRRAAMPATAQELTTGHGAAAVLVSAGAGVARLIGSVSQTVDFVDHFRSAREEFDYQWEERWVRDEGYLKLVPRLVATVLNRTGVRAQDIAHFCFPCTLPKVPETVAKLIGVPEGSISNNLMARCGDTGAAHPLLMLINTLETAKPGEKILVIGFGQGGDALIFEVTDAIIPYRVRGTGAAKWLARRSLCPYARYLVLNGLLKIGAGIRAEADKGTAMTAAYRHRDFLTGFEGGRCTVCGTLQIPRTRTCANPDCHAVDSQQSHPFAESVGRVVSFTSDNLTYSPDPPAIYGMIDFDGGGRLMMDFTNVIKDDVQIGTPMRMVFRIKDHDSRRAFSRYFWKAAPQNIQELA
ncbi:MAG TPA: OB-fold domain-containing protein [Candidatus Acidoferrum sp.]|nr:OB-fold domain-containing protein [Candidatus Acidoferrum sp.]